jgi:CBS domain-containing protein
MIDRGDFPHAHSDHSLHSALDRMGAAGVEALPVVSRADVHQLLGIVTLDDVLALYRVRSKETTK